MRTILFSLITLFTISTTGCLDDAQQPGPDQKGLAEALQPELSDQVPADQAKRDEVPDQPIALQDEIDESGAERP